MKTSNTGINLIKQFEGCRLTAYTDSVGVLTIGYGHTKSVKAGQTITEAQATEYLKADLATAEKYVNKHSEKYNFNQNQFDALVSFTFNCGAANLTKLTNSDKRTIAQISEKIPAYNKAGGKVLNGLTRRRAAEKALFDTASGANSSGSEFYPAYTGTAQNLDVILKDIGVPAQYYGNITKRIAFVKLTGLIDNYKGTYAQNIKLIALAKAGKIPKVN